MTPLEHRQRAAELEQEIGEALSVIYAQKTCGFDRFLLAQLLLNLHFAHMDAIEALECELAARHRRVVTPVEDAGSG